MLSDMSKYPDESLLKTDVMEKWFQSNPFWFIGSGFVARIFGDLSKIGYFLGGHYLDFNNCQAYSGNN